MIHFLIERHCYGWLQSFRNDFQEEQINRERSSENEVIEEASFITFKLKCLSFHQVLDCPPQVSV